MDRRERIFRDRAEMARRALIEAKYLTGGETKEELKSSLKEAIANFLADSIHLFDVQERQEGFFQEILMATIRASESDIKQSRF